MDLTCRGLVLSEEDRLRREVIQQIMCRFRVEKSRRGLASARTKM
jgi:hypothetical protein